MKILHTYEGGAECSEMLAYKLQMLVNHQEEGIQQLMSYHLPIEITELSSGTAQS
jgi:hypothetical protein